MKLIVGLGNPGKQYEKTRHNVGFRVLNALEDKFDTSEFKLNKKSFSEVSTIKIDGEKIILAKPQTFMNLSGKAVAALKNYYNLNNSDIWVVADELDLPLGTIRIRHAAKSSTHNGIKNISSSIGEDFVRIRVGILGDKEFNAEVYVLSKFSKSEENVISQAIDETADLILSALENKNLKAETVDILS